MYQIFCFVFLILNFCCFAQTTDSLLQASNQTKISELYQRLGNLENSTVQSDQTLLNELDSKIKILSDSILMLNKKIEGLNTLSYMVQFYMSKSEVETSILFKNINDITLYKENGYCKYTAGHFYDFEKAQKHKKQLIEIGYKDAFVLMFQNGKRIN